MVETEALPVFVWDPPERLFLDRDGVWHLVTGTGRRMIEDEEWSIGFYVTACGMEVRGGSATAHFPIGDICNSCKEEHSASRSATSKDTAQSPD